MYEQNKSFVTFYLLFGILCSGPPPNDHKGLKVEGPCWCPEGCFLNIASHTKAALQSAIKFTSTNFVKLVAQRGAAWRELLFSKPVSAAWYFRCLCRCCNTHDFLPIIIEVIGFMVAASTFQGRYIYIRLATFLKYFHWVLIERWL